MEQVPHLTVLDVGPGWGKYAVLLREYLNVKPTRVDAVEAWPPYVADHRLTRLYDTVYHGYAQERLWRPDGGVGDIEAATVLGEYDLVLMVDVIEHMTHHDALTVVKGAQGRVVICTPVAFFHNGDGLPPTEDHVSAWDRTAFRELAAGAGRAIEAIDVDQGGWLVRLAPAPGWSPEPGGPRGHRVVT